MTTDTVDPFTEESLVPSPPVESAEKEKEEGVRELASRLPLPLPEGEEGVDAEAILQFEEEVQWSGGRRGRLIQNVWEDLSAEGKDVSDPETLTREMIATPVHLAMWGSLQVEQESLLEAEELKYDIWHAVRAAEARSALKEGASKSFQPTDKAIEAWIVSHKEYGDEYETWQVHLLNLRRKNGQCKVMVRSYELRGRILQSVGALTRMLWEGAEGPSTRRKGEGEL